MADTPPTPPAPGNNKGKGKGRDKAPTTDAQPTAAVQQFFSGFTPINATQLPNLQPPIQTQTAATGHDLSALRSTIDNETDAADAAARTLMQMHRSGPRPAIPSVPSQQPSAQTAPDFDNEGDETPVPRQPAASFRHAIAGSSNDPGPLQPPSDADSEADGEDEAIGSTALKPTVDRSQYFPHNFPYEDINTRGDMVAYFDPKNKKPLVHPDDLLDAMLQGYSINEKERNLRQLFLEAAVDGYNNAPRVDHDAGTDQGTADDNKEWANNWDALKKKYAVSVVKGALTVGYRIAKREQLIKDGRGHEFFVCPRDQDQPAGCTSQQYRRDSARTAIADYFGRSKKPTKINNRMPEWCRQHYQRDSYDDSIWQLSKRALIKKYLDALEQAAIDEGYRNLTFDISLVKRDTERVVQVATGKGDGSPAASELHPQDLETLQHIYNEYVGKGKSREDCKRLVDWAHNDFVKKLKAWREEKEKEGKDLKTVKTREEFKKYGPKHCPYEMVPDWRTLLGAKKYKLKLAEVQAQEAEAKKKKAEVKGPVSNTPKRDRNTPRKEKKKKGDGDEEEESEAETPSKKPRKK